MKKRSVSKRKVWAVITAFLILLVSAVPVSAGVISGQKVENPHYNIMKMEGGTVSTAAEGKPKVLIFYKPDCYNCQTMMGIIRDSGADFQGVDVIAADISGSSMDVLQEFCDTYGRDQITFGYRANAVMWNYLSRVGVTGSVTTPAVIFIGGNDQIVYYSTGMNREILTDIETYLDVSLTGTPPEDDGDSWGERADTSWYDESRTEFTLTTAEQAAGLASLVNAGNTFEGKKILLGQDLYFNDGLKAENPWTPIASKESGAEFQGTFDGQGHSLYNLYLPGDAGGFFGTIGESGIVKALRVEQGVIRSAAAVAEVNKGWLLFCENRSDITSSATYTGGVCCWNENLVYGCGNSGAIKADNTAGGVIGNNALYEATVDSCWNEGSVKSGRNYVGGIAGESTGWLFNCYNAGDISGGCTGLGGIAGSQGAGTDGMVKLYNCYNIGGISGEASRNDTICGNLKGSCSNVYAAPSLYNGLAEELSLEEFRDPETVEKLQGDLVIPKWTAGSEGLNGGYIVNTARADMEEGIWKMLPDIWYPVTELSIGMDASGKELDAFQVAYYGSESVGAVYSTEDEAILSITPEGIVTPKKSGTAVVRVTFPESEHGKETWFDVTVTVDVSTVKGDVDGSGKVDISDLRLVLRAVCSKIELTEAQESLADVETDGEVDIKDLRKILRFVCKKIDTLD